MSFHLGVDYQPRGDSGSRHRSTFSRHTRRRTTPGAAWSHRLRQNLHHGPAHREDRTPGPGSGSQQNPGRAALSRIQPASAQDKAAAEALFDEGKRLFLDKKFAEACPRFEASERIDPGIGTLLFLADCYENVGRVASAWATFREACLRRQGRRRRPSARPVAQRARAKLLEPRLYRLTLNVESPAPASR